MSAIVFVGPTIPVDDVRGIIDAECRPPVAQGDVYRAALCRPRMIGIIDGYFDGVPSVWHKEILWAMAQGIHVFGSASMGALRASELADFGMRGVGRIFEDYRSGRLADDDEVAVLHAPAELGFAALSEPMVSIRATLERAEAEGALAGSQAPVLVDLAKAMHYRHRTWEAILKAAADFPGLGVFREWLEVGRIDAKREDAIAMLQAMAAAMAADEEAAPVGYSFERTHVWDDLTGRVDAEQLAAGETDRMVLNELRLDQERYRELRGRAALRGLALDAAERGMAGIERAALLEEMSRHRSRNGLMRRRDLAEWLARNDLDETGYEALVAESCRIEAGSALPPDALARHLLAELKWSGDFAALRRRAIDKARFLGAAGQAGSPAPPVESLKPVIWYFEEQLGQEVPHDLDGYARGIGLGDRQELYRILRQEYLYSLSGKDRHEDDRPA